MSHEEFIKKASNPNMDIDGDNEELATPKVIAANKAITAFKVGMARRNCCSV